VRSEKSGAPMELRRWISVGGIEEASFLSDSRACSRLSEWRDRNARAVRDEEASATRTRRDTGVFSRSRNDICEERMRRRMWELSLRSGSRAKDNAENVSGT
jgi:hypothetical protein